MNVFEPAKPKRRRAKGDSPQLSEKSDSNAPALEAGASVFGAKLGAVELSLGAKLPLWTVKEATYLTAGCKPPSGPAAIAKAASEFDWLNEPILYRETLLKRHLMAGDAGEHITPLEAMQLLHRLEQWIDPNMLNAVQSYHRPPKTNRVKIPKGSLGDFMDDLRSLEALESDEPEAATKRILTLLKYLLAMAVEKYGFVPSRYGNPTAGRIVAALEKIRLKGDDGTVSSYLKMAVEAHWTEPSG